MRQRQIERAHGLGELVRRRLRPRRGIDQNSREAGGSERTGRDQRLRLGSRSTGGAVTPDIGATIGQQEVEPAGHVGGAQGFGGVRQRLRWR